MHHTNTGELIFMVVATVLFGLVGGRLLFHLVTGHPGKPGTRWNQMSRSSRIQLTGINCFLALCFLAGAISALH